MIGKIPQVSNPMIFMVYYSLIRGLGGVVICNKTLRISTGRKTRDTSDLTARMLAFHLFWVDFSQV